MRCKNKHPLNGERCVKDAGHTGNCRLADKHRCHARGCITPCKPEYLMCPKHWRMVPRALQQAVYDAYRPGQCDDKNPSRAWHEAADAAIDAVERQEKCTPQFQTSQPKPR